VARLYKRSYELVITPNEGESKTIRNLRINFEITKSVLSFPNLAKITIYNPNEDTLSLLNKKYTKIYLNAGYGDNMGLLFKGELRNLIPSKFGVDRAVVIYAGDGERDWQNSLFNKTFTENVSIKAAIEDVLKTFKETTIGIIEGIPDIADKLLGHTLSGSSKDILDNFAEEYNFDWNIQDGEITIAPTSEALLPDEAVLINSATGMIGSPTVTEIGADVTTLLNSKLLPNRAFKIESISVDIQLGNLFFRDIKKTTAEGIYKIQEVIFKGDSREGDWTSSIKGKLISG